MSSNIIGLVPNVFYEVNNMGKSRRWFRATPERIFMDMSDGGEISIDPSTDIREEDHYKWYTYGSYLPFPLKDEELIDLYLRYERLL